MQKLLPPIPAFLLFLVLFSGLADIPFFTAFAAHPSLANLYITVFMWTPGLAALATRVLYNLPSESFGWNWPETRRMPLGYLLPLAYIVPVYLATWLLIPGSLQSSTFFSNGAKAAGFPAFPHAATLGLYLPVILTFGVLMRLPNTLGEEIGWRGFLLPQLTRRFGFSLAALITGSLWALWHYPMLAAFGFFTAPNAFARMLCFTLMVIALSFVIGWLRLKTESLWPCVLMHASHNAFLQVVFDPATDRNKTTLITTEFGAGLALTVGATALYLCLRRPKSHN
ncbi:MAG TPA: type II CAAX endopeptidase family protein [Edaphobacter sp.]